MVAESDSAGFRMLLRMVERRVADGSLRGVASELGMSPSGLAKVLAGARSQAGTRRRLERWAVWQRAYDAEAAGPPLAASAHMLVHGLPSDLHPETLSQLAEVLATSYAAAGVSAPEWVAELRAAGPAPSP